MLGVNDKGESLFDYVEDYQGVKYDTFPDEFKELIQARKVLKPYWEIQTQVEDIFGKPTTPSRQRRFDSLVSRMKKRLRRTNPEIDRYLTPFYTQV